MGIGGGCHITVPVEVCKGGGEECVVEGLGRGEVEAVVGLEEAQTVPNFKVFFLVPRRPQPQVLLKLLL